MSSNSSGKWLAQRADEIIASIWTTDYQELVAEIDRLASEDTRHADKGKAMDHQRVVADLRVLAAHKKGRPVAECEAIYADRVRLGFSTVADEVIAAGAHARYCRQAGNMELASRHAAAALKTIELTRDTAKPSVPGELEGVLRDIVGQQRE
jgi:hypothetical protein